jgi:hypothetical protein
MEAVMNKLDIKINSLTNEIVVMKNLPPREAFASVQNLLNTDMSKASVISFLKYAIQLHSGKAK